MENVRYLPESNPILEHSDSKGIRYCVPDLPCADDILPLWQSLEIGHRYSNFGPLEQGLRRPFMQRFFQTDAEQFVTFTNSGTSAITLALKTLKLPLGSKVLLPALTFPATALAIINAGLTPVFVDTVDELELNVEHTYQLIQQYDIRAVVPVFYHSQRVSPLQWDQFYIETGIPVVIDACPALDIQNLPEHCILAFSLHATKYYGIGEGGAVVACDQSFIADVRKLSNFALDNGVVTDWGENAKLSEYHAAVGHAQLARYAEIKSRKETVIEYYRNVFNTGEGIKLISDLNRNPSYMLISSEFCAVSELCDHLNQQGIESRRFHYPLLPAQDFFKQYQYISATEHKERLPEQLLSLPFHNFLSKKDVDTISETIQSCLFNNTHVTKSLSNI